MSSKTSNLNEFTLSDLEGIDKSLKRIRDKRDNTGNVCDRVVIKDTRPVEEIKIEDNYYLVVLKINNKQLGSDLEEVLKNLLFRSVKISDAPEDTRKFIETALTFNNKKELDEFCHKNSKYANAQHVLNLWTSRILLATKENLPDDVLENPYNATKYICTTIANNSDAFDLFQSNCIDESNFGKIVDVIKSVRNPGTQIETRYSMKDDSILFRD